MGQATVDLPDPLDQQPPTANSGGMDDLLSQLAGDEIDRLLAEADEAVPPSLGTPIDAPVEPIHFDDEPSPPAPVVAPKLSPNSPLAKLNQLADVPAESGADAASAVAADESMTVDAETQASLDALSSELGGVASDQMQSGVLPPNAVQKVLADEAAGLLGTRPAAARGPAAPAEEFGTSADERGALSAGVDAELAQAATSKKPLGAAKPEAAAPVAISSKELNAVLGYGNDEAPLPLLLRPLEWINAPLDACPQGVRDTIGKAAIITMINAVAVLAYVAFFRR
jgi:hypothetical protein